MHRAVFFDRDNTLIVNDGDLGDPDRVELARGAAAAVASLRGLGYKIIVATNQGGVARGKYGEAEVEAVHERIADLLLAQTNGAVIDGFYYCPFHPEGSVQRYRKEHPWRKPQPGMLLQAAEDLKLDLSMSWMIGDAERDVVAGHRAGVRTVMLHEPDADPAPPPSDPEAHPDFTARTLVEAARIVAQQMHPEPEPPAGRDADAQSPRAPSGMTYPATQALSTSQSRPSQGAASTRPFKPWSIQPRTPEDDLRGVARRDAEPTPASESPPTGREASRGLAESAGSEGEAEPKIRAPRSPEPLTPRPPADAADEPSHPEHQASASRPVESAPPSSTADRVEADRAPGSDDVEADDAAEMVEQEPILADSEDEALEAKTPARPGDETRLLHQILRELRYRRAHESDWSMSKMCGLGIAQPLAGICAVLAVLNFGQLGTLVAWLLGAVFLQLLVLTLMVLHWQR